MEKGKKLENYVVDLFRKNGFKASRSAGSGSGNRDKADIVTDVMIEGENVGIECKNHAKPNFKEWWKQAMELQKLRMIPVLVWKLGGERFTQTKATIHLETLVDLLVGYHSNADNIQEVKYDYEKQREIRKACEALWYSLTYIDKGSAVVNDTWLREDCQKKIKGLMKVLDI